MSESTLINALEASTDPMMVFCAKAAIVSMTTIVVVIALISVWVVVSGVWDMVRNWYERWSYTRAVRRARKERENGRRTAC